MLEISLNSIKKNYTYLKSQLGNGVACAAVVKADAYGLGIKKISQALIEAGCKDFFVTNCNEGVNLRDVLSTSQSSAVTSADVYVLHGVSNDDEADACVQYGLTPVLNHVGQSEVWKKKANKLGNPLSAILHIDTGLNRLGFPFEDVHNFIESQRSTPNMELRYIMSHLSCADTPTHDSNASQLKNFLEIATLFPNVPLTFANSSGIFLGPGYHFNMVRPGAAMYGFSPTPHTLNPMLPVLTLKAKILQRKVLEQKSCVGYGAAYIADTGSKLLIIECGYSNGYCRMLNICGKAYVAGYFLPIAGRISMDLCTLDASILPNNIFLNVDFVELLNEHLTIDDLAKAANTIPYELSIILGSHCKRVYK
ncbi:Alanine racemase, catabolic [Alphaproteobacteria bacterium]